MTRFGPLLSSVTLLHLFGNSNGARAGESKSAKAPDPEDPFAYCSRVTTADSPAGGRSPVPRALAPYLARALGLSADVEVTAERYYWRCMDRAVYVCAIGANLPCDTRADLAKRNLGAMNYCRDNLSATEVPAYATGHRTIYSWHCSAGRAVRGKQLIKVDARGFQSGIWFRVSTTQLSNHVDEVAP
jgi:hypothetical protein